MRKFTPVFIIGLFLALACILYAATTKPELPPEDTIIKRADYPSKNVQIDIYKTRADIAMNGQTHILTGTAKTDKYGAVELV